MKIALPFDSLQLNQTSNGMVVRNPSEVGSDGKYVYQADESTVTFDFSKGNTSEACGLKSVALFSDNQGTPYTGSQVVFDNVTLTTTVDTRQSFDQSIYYGFTTRGGVSQYVPVAFIVKPTKSYSHCYNDISSLQEGRFLSTQVIQSDSPTVSFKAWTNLGSCPILEYKLSTSQTQFVPSDLFTASATCTSTGDCYINSEISTQQTTQKLYIWAFVDDQL